MFLSASTKNLLLEGNVAVNNTQSAIYIESTCVNFTVSHNLMVICCKNHYGIFMPCIILVVKPGRLVGAVNNFSKYYPRLSFLCDLTTHYKVSFRNFNCFFCLQIATNQLPSVILSLYPWMRPLGAFVIMSPLGKVFSNLAAGMEFICAN